MNATETPLASRILWVFAALFIILGVGYSSVTPIFENSDETLHYPYVKQLADGRGLPLAVPGQLWNQEGTQHPLYYAIVAASTFWIDSDNLPIHLQRNPHWLFSDVRALINDNQNLVLHGPMDAFPYRQAALAIHMGRWWSLAFGLVTVISTYLVARHLFPYNLPLQVTAVALTALNPQFIRVSTTVSNDSLSAALSSLTVFVALKFMELAPVFRRGEPLPLSLRLRTSAPVLLGLLCGLALLTKLSGMTTFFLVVILIFWRLWFLSEIHHAPLRLALKWIATISLIMLAMTGWWFWRNYQLYGEWLATETHLNLAGRGNLSLSEVWALRAEIERAFWATFGWGQIRPPEWVFQMLAWFTRLGLISLTVAFVGKIVQGPKPGPLPLNFKTIDLAPIIFLVLWAAMNVALYLRWVMEVGSVSHARLMFPAIAAVSILLAVGWHALWPRRYALLFSGLAATLLLLLNVYSLGWLIYPAFTPSGQISDIANQQVDKVGAAALAKAVDLPLVTALNLTFLDSLRLLSGQISVLDSGITGPKPDPQATQGDIIVINADWEVLAAPDKNYSVAAVLLAPDGSVLARRETYPGLGLRPTAYLQPGQRFRDSYPLRLVQDINEPVVAQATVNLFDFDTEARAGFPAVDEAGSVRTAVVGHIKIVPRFWPSYTPTQTARANFDDLIALVGYDFHEASAQEPAALVLYWESSAPVIHDYVVFLHLLDEAGHVIAQADAPPTNNAYPTSWWSPGEVIADRRNLPGPANGVTLQLGLYNFETGQRLTVIETTLPNRDNAVEIALP